MKSSTLAPVSNQETWQDVIEFIDDDTGGPWFTEADSEGHPSDVTLKLRDPDSGRVVLKGSITDGKLAIVADGAIEFTFPASSMRSLCPKTYEIGVIYSAAGSDTQAFLGRLPVLKGL